MSLINQLFSTVFRKNYFMLTAVFASGFAFEVSYNKAMDKVWDNLNRGRQWKDIRHKYIEGEDDE